MNPADILKTYEQLPEAPEGITPEEDSREESSWIHETLE